MERQKKVVDASVIVKWFLNENDSDKARRVKKAYFDKENILVVPDFVFLEVLNTLRFKGGKKDDLNDVNKSLHKTQLNIQSINKEILVRVIGTSLEYNITIYDALYVALAQIHDCELITADKELYKIPNVIPLEKF